MKPQLQSFDMREIRKLFAIREDGVLVRKARPREEFIREADWRGFNTKLANKPVGYKPTKNGYRQVLIGNQTVKAHRVVWALTHGAWPTGHIDHIDGNPGNNHPSNLRDVGRAENMQNRKGPTKGSVVPFLGVSIYKPRGTYRARLRINGKGVTLGYFKTPEEAHSAYLQAKRVHHPGCTL